MPNQLHYVIKFVADMDQAVKFYRDTVGFTLKYQTPDWSEFATGETLLALHLASPTNPPGSVQLGLRVSNMQTFYREMVDKGVKFSQEPTAEHEVMVARFLDMDGKECSVSEAR
jgi:catechol 2,3-dioxygenase-like lactoylglutathione lyase family enzyme